MHGVAPRMCGQISQSTVRRRSRGSLPRLPLLLPESRGQISCVTSPLPAALVDRGNARLLHVRDGAGQALAQALAYVYYEDEPGRAWRIAGNIANPPELLREAL